MPDPQYCLVGVVDEKKVVLEYLVVRVTDDICNGSHELPKLSAGH